MSKLFVCIITLFFLSGAAMSLSGTDKKIIGNWRFEVPSAPYGYQKGVFSIKDKNDKLVGEVRFFDGYKVELKNVMVSGDSLTFGLHIDYNYISIKALVDSNNILTGTIQTPEGMIKVSAKRE